MTTKRTRLRVSRSWWFDLGLCVLGLSLLLWSLPIAWEGGWKVGLAALLGVPLVVVIARFPMVLDNEDGSIEIGFDSIVLIYLLCTFDALPALAVWGLGVLTTQLTSGKRASAFVFNIGVGILGDPTRGDRQNDVLTYGLSVARAVREGLEVVGEINGRLDTRAGAAPVGTESRGAMRIGGRFTRSTVRADAGFIVGMTSRDPSIGLTAGVTWVFKGFTIP